MTEAQEAKQAWGMNTCLRKLVADLSLDKETFAVGDPKKRIELVAKAAVEHVQLKYAFSQREGFGF